MSSFTPARLAYVISEPACGSNESLPPVIFLHGTMATKECWGSIPQAIADQSHRKVYSLDTRNHGDGEWSDNFDFDINSGDLLHFMDSEAIPKAVLIGHSMGGVTCVQTAFKHPERVETAFIVDMFVKKVPQKFLNAIIALIQLFEDAVKTLPNDCSEAEAQKSIFRYAASSRVLTDAIFTLFTRGSKQKNCSSAPKRNTPKKQPAANNKQGANSKLQLKINDQGKYSLKFNTKAISKAMESEELLMSEPKGLFESPVYFLYGTESPYNVDEDAYRIRKHFPNAELIGIEGAGHNVHLDMPEEFTQEILNHLVRRKNKQEF